MRPLALPAILAALFTASLASACADEEYPYTEDKAGVTDLLLANTTAAAIDVRYEMFRPGYENDVNAGALSIAANETRLMTYEWTLGGAPRPAVMLTFIEVRDADTQQPLYAQAPITDDDWALTDGGSWEYAEYTLTIAH